MSDCILQDLRGVSKLRNKQEVNMSVNRKSTIMLTIRHKKPVGLGVVEVSRYT